MSINRGIKKEDAVYTHNGLLERYEIVPFAETWMDLETVIQTEGSHNEKKKYHIIYVESRKMVQVNLFAKQK